MARDHRVKRTLGFRLMRRNNVWKDKQDKEDVASDCGPNHFCSSNLWKMPPLKVELRQGCGSAFKLCFSLKHGEYPQDKWPRHR
jgi:hypothetical protein